MILIADDDAAIRESLMFLLRRKGYEAVAVASPEEAVAEIRSRSFELVLMDMNYSLSTSGEEGIELLRKVKVLSPETPVILITAWGSISLAVEGMRHGAFDFITKPWNNLLLLQRIETAISLSRGGMVEGGDEASPVFDRCGIIGENPALRELLSTVERIAPTEAPVLVLGENGTGKELVAKAIHANSRRKDNPLVMVNLGGISSSLFESEMFGHTKGAFTGAAADRKGRFELADKGTVFLDEIGDLDLNCQVKLLRVLQQHTFERLGESVQRKTDIRVVCATNADLRAMVADRTFREDLYYRINMITLRLPPLRERRDDIPALARHFAGERACALGLRGAEFTPEAMAYLTRLDYPGNIRQLRNMVDRAVFLCGGKPVEKSLLESDPSASMTVDVGCGTHSSVATLDELERNAIREALLMHDGNVSKAAVALGITRQALYRKMEKHDIRP